ncbi:hypothetical protein [Desulfitobacterium hafniense]|uniref:hypothetical protein n=1 Tax=Desulfitobacterium hafniense TaxID=49338 RepID=UPI0003622F59|nr:hypothetical protein [Desulfitobacterium hafniense]
MDKLDMILGKLVNMENKFVNMENKFVNMENKFINMEDKLERMESDIKALRADNREIHRKMDDFSFVQKQTLEAVKDLDKEVVRHDDQIQVINSKIKAL